MNASRCLYCGEEIAPGDGVPITGPDGPEAMHRACLLRTVVGSVGHIKKACHCFGGCEEDPPGLTKRQGALAAEKLYLRVVEGKQFFAA